MTYSKEDDLINEALATLTRRIDALKASNRALQAARDESANRFKALRDRIFELEKQLSDAIAVVEREANVSKWPEIPRKQPSPLDVDDHCLAPNCYCKD